MLAPVSATRKLGRSRLAGDEKGEHEQFCSDEGEKPMGMEVGLVDKNDHQISVAQN